MLRIWLLLLLIALLEACTTSKVLTGVRYNIDKRSSFYELDFWEFEGRAAVQSTSDSGSFNIVWRHRGAEDNLRLSGFLGQGTVEIKMSGNRIEVDRGDGHASISEQPDELLKRQLGFSVPVTALRYWVLGLPDADKYFEPEAEGFRQSGWNVRFIQWMQEAGNEMPHKIAVNNEELKLKLVIDQWELSREIAQ